MFWPRYTLSYSPGRLGPYSEVPRLSRRPSLLHAYSRHSCSWGHFDGLGSDERSGKPERLELRSGIEFFVFRYNLFDLVAQTQGKADAR